MTRVKILKVHNHRVIRDILTYVNKRMDLNGKALLNLSIGVNDDGKEELKITYIMDGE